MHSLVFTTSELSWDSDYFGIKCAKVILKKELSTTDWKNVKEFSEKYDFLTIVNKGNIPSNNFQIGNTANIFLSDVNVQLSKKVVAEVIDEIIEIHESLMFDSNICKLAENGFRYSRFYNDPHLNTHKSRNIYLQWVLNAFEKKGKFFVTIKRERVVVGFILFSINPDSTTCATIELIAVDSAYKGMQIGTRLIKGMENFLQEKNIKTVNVGTQADNLPAINFYQSCGFRSIECNSVYHYWPKKN